MFYTMPQDPMQEHVAQELWNRLWRYHKPTQMWLMRDNTYAEPAQIGNEAERGYYVVFDYNVWKKVKKESVVRYEDLDNPTNPGRGVQRSFAPGGV